MTKRKLQRFAENDTFANVFQPWELGYPPKGFKLKGKWNEDFFGNDHPIVLEIGCGRGEYTVGLAKLFPDKNFIGIDIKGARLWRGAKTAIEENLNNVAFLRIAIDQVHYFFAENEVSELWITFPDPQPQISREKKRLSSPNFINKYLKFLKKGATIHLKTDNVDFYEYTLSVIKELNYSLKVATTDLYHSHATDEPSPDNFRGEQHLTNKKQLITDEILGIKTTYENIFLKKGMTICYLNFTVSSQ